MRAYAKIHTYSHERIATLALRINENGVCSHSAPGRMLPTQCLLQNGKPIETQQLGAVINDFSGINFSGGYQLVVPFFHYLEQVIVDFQLEQGNLVTTDELC